MTLELVKKIPMEMESFISLGGTMLYWLSLRKNSKQNQNNTMETTANTVLLKLKSKQPWFNPGNLSATSMNK